MGALGAGAALLLLAALGTPPGLADGAVHVVLVLEDRFQDVETGTPATTARVGDVVEFRLVQGFHTATRGVASVSLAALGGPDSPLLTDEGQAYRYVVSEAGLVPYTCIVHAHMQGALVAS